MDDTHDRASVDDAQAPDEDRHAHDRSTDPAGAVSNQNGEEAESGLRQDQTHPEPRTDDRPDAPQPGAA